ncbi:FAD-binding oxidoreductase [Thermocatellispora tengchongensis]|uniref:FAD-binding oxidoreductase n=1 Tax=Thermocatellispora tengchongensis TaxID=1073253 RepID=UPI00362A8C10
MLASAGPAAAGLLHGNGDDGPQLGPVTVRPSDPRYEDLAVRRTNQRFRHEPEYFVVASSTEQVVRAVGEAVRAGKRVTVRSGGHCYENFVGDGAQVVIDLCEMSRVYFDEERGAFAVEAGTTLMSAYRRLYLGWGVTFPGGQCGGVAAGGTSRAAATGRCRGATASRSTICTRWRSWWWTARAGPARWWPPATRPTRTTTCGGRTPVAAAGASAS